MIPALAFFAGVYATGAAYLFALTKGLVLWHRLALAAMWPVLVVEGVLE